MIKLTSDQIKTVAIVAMLIDHIAAVFFTAGTIEYFLGHLVGRITIPVMCFFVAEGYNYTRDIKKYAARLLMFAVISHIPFYYFSTGIIPLSAEELLISLTHTSVMWSLFLGLVALAVFRSCKLIVEVKCALIFLLAAFAVFGDWRFFPIIWIIIFDAFRHDNFKRFMFFSVSALLYIALQLLGGFLSQGIHFSLLYYRIGLLLAVPLLLLYDGTRSKSQTIKWAFYCFYPAHLIILACLRSALVYLL